jgi:signal transduction histidine kinase
MPRRTLRTQLTLLYAGPFILSGALLLGVGVVQTRQSRPMGQPAGGEEIPHVLSTSAAILAALVLVSIVIGWLVAGRFLQPLRTITATARDISATNLHRRLGRTGRTDDLAELASTLDDLFARLEAAFASQQNFVANASHELRTPLTATRTLMQVALADPGANVDSLRAACQDVLALGEAQERLIEALLTLAGGEQGVEHREPFDLAAVTRGVLQSRATGTVQVTSELAAAPATGDPRLVESLVANLVDNALLHNVPDGWVEITTVTMADGARLTVRNTGPIIPPDQVERLFEPFQQLAGQRIQHTTGHGLGLAIVRAIVNAHGGTLSARSRPEGGLHINVTLPAR